MRWVSRLIGMVVLVVGLSGGLVRAEDGDGDDGRSPVPPITSEAAGEV